MNQLRPPNYPYPVQATARRCQLPTRKQVDNPVTILVEQAVHGKTVQYKNTTNTSIDAWALPYYQAVPNVWIKDRFPVAGRITETVARLSLPSSAKEKHVSLMVVKLQSEREAVKNVIKGEVDELLRLGTETTGMTYYINNPNLKEPCVTPRNMRTSFCQDGSDENLKRLHYIFHELPYKTHEDVLMKRETHGDVVVANVMEQLNIAWGPKKEGETVAHTNCIAHMYSRIMNEKKQTIVKKGDANTHNRIPSVRSLKNAKGASYFYSNNVREGKQMVSKMKQCMTGAIL